MQNSNQPVGWMVEISGADKFFYTKKSAENARRRYEKTFDAERIEPYALFASPPAPVAPEAIVLLRRVVACGALTFDSQPDFESLEADICACLDKVKERNR